MILVNRFLEFLTECKAIIPEINREECVLDNSELTHFTREHSTVENQLLIGIMPEFDTGGSRDLDAIQENSHIGLMILSKVDYSEFSNRNDFLQIFAETQTTTIKLLEYIISQAQAEDGYCDLFSDIDVGSIAIDPIWKMDQCNGWMLRFSMSA